MHTERSRVSLKIVPSSTLGKAISAPPILDASSHTIDYVCGSCKTVLLQAEDGQVHNVLIKCVTCGTFNSTDS